MSLHKRHKRKEEERFGLLFHQEEEMINTQPEGSGSIHSTIFASCPAPEVSGFRPVTLFLGRTPSSKPEPEKKQ